MFATATHGFARAVSRSLAACELTHQSRQPVDLILAGRQHEAYVTELRAAGVDVTVLTEAPELPDAMFVEDVAILLDELAILARPGVASRRPEVALIAPEIAAIRRVAEISAPGTLEGGDVLRVARTLFVGRSARTNAEGIRQLAEIVSAFGYIVRPVSVKGCLHLKSAVTAAADSLLIANPQWIDAEPFRGFEILTVPATEPATANVLAINDRVLVAVSAPQTADLLAARGLDVRRLDISELQKAEAALTCSSVLYTQSEA